MGMKSMTLEEVRDSLIRQEDTIVFSLIERARFPMNSFAYEDVSSFAISGFSTSLLKYFVKEIEATNAKVGRYESPEEHPFFPDDLPNSLIAPRNDSQTYHELQFLHPAAASINVNNHIWDFYLKQLRPLIAAEGDDGNYASSAASDLQCLQALSRRIHYGKFVAEVKFRDAPQDYEPLIRAKDRDALMKLLTFERVEEMVKRRVERKAMVFGQEVCLGTDGDKGDNKGKYKVDPAVVSRLYDEWVMPLTKLVEVEYLLRRLD
ncbi:hypothetical protein RJ641_006231 [Dillenia turbinata]|uniref:Chorismate mutase n=1 Tax=Dillenia turbinata TaxID=194707 RepID=A0AAN8V509_9MAGN